MSNASELLNSMTTEGGAAYPTDPSTEPHIVIDADRHIHVPEELRRIAVQHDHNIETVTFDCPRYWDGVDMSVMRLYINYMRGDGDPGSYLTKVRIDESDDSMMHFDWVISENVTAVAGSITFLVMAVKTNAETGKKERCWNTERNSEMIISSGLSVSDDIVAEYPDVIDEILTRLESCENGGAGTYFVTPQMYGAKGDGVTDDTEAIQSAFSVGGTIRIPKGDYLVTSALYPKSNSNIVFDNGARLIEKTYTTIKEGNK